MANARLYQQYTEVLTADVGYAELTQQTVEVLTADVGYAELAHIYVETLAVAVSAAQIYQCYVEALTPAVGSSTDEGVSNTLSFTGVANLTWSLNASNTITFSQTENNSLTKFANNSITFTQDFVVWRQYDVSQTITFTSDAQPTVEETASNTLSFGQTVSADLARHTSGDLSFGQSVALHLVAKRSSPETLSFSETVGLNSTLNPSASNTLNLTQSLIRVLEFDIQSTIIFNQDESEDVTYPASNTITFSAGVSATRPFGRSLTSTLSFGQSLSAHQVRNCSLSNTLSLTQTPHLIFPRSVTHVETFYHNLDYTLTKTTSNTITFSQDATETHNKLRRVFANINFTQATVVNNVINQSLTSTLNFTQSLIRNIDEDLSSTITFNEVVDYTWSKRVVQTVTFGQVVNVAKVIRRSLISTLNLIESNSHLKTINKRMLSLLRLTNNGRIVPIFNRTTNNTFAPSQDLARDIFTESQNDFVTLSHSFSVVHVKNLSASSNLNLTQVFVGNWNKSFDITDTLVFPDHRTKSIRIGDLTEVTIPNVIETLISGETSTNRRKRTMTISVPERTVLLPIAEFGDGEGNTDTFTMSYAVDGTVYTTVRKSGTRNINFSWDLSYPKAEELKEFLWNYNAKAMTIETWKGETWIVRLLTNPIDFVDNLRPSLCESDSSVAVTLEFEGLRIH